MKIIFNTKDFRHSVPNFVKTNIGRVDLKDLDKKEIEDLKITLGYALEDNWRRRRNSQSD